MNFRKKTQVCQIQEVLQTVTLRESRLISENHRQG